VAETKTIADVTGGCVVGGVGGSNSSSWGSNFKGMKEGEKEINSTSLRIVISDTSAP